MKSAYLKVGLPQQKIYTIKIASLTIMEWKDTGRLMISVTFYLYARRRCVKLCKIGGKGEIFVNFA